MHGRRFDRTVATADVGLRRDTAHADMKEGRGTAQGHVHQATYTGEGWRGSHMRVAAGFNVRRALQGIKSPSWIISETLRQHLAGAP